MSIEQMSRDIDRWISDEQRKFSYSTICKTCNGTGWYLIKEDSGMGYPMASKTKCECFDKIANGQSLVKSGISDEYTFENFNVHEDFQKYLVDISFKFLNSPTYWLYIGGQIGSGKTRLCKTIIRDLISKGYQVITMNWQDDATDLKSMSMTPEYKINLDRFKNARVLYIDDFFKSGNVEQISKADKELAFKIIDYRYQHQELITIFSSEHFFSELLAIDESMSRIAERCTKEFVVSIPRSNNNNIRLK
jgi:DNA replication protein DnaC